MFLPEVLTFRTPFSPSVTFGSPMLCHGPTFPINCLAIPWNLQLIPLYNALGALGGCVVWWRELDGEGQLASRLGVVW